jgi:ABC-type Mn2+/Zn2+ transport system ATPase subunit
MKTDCILDVRHLSVRFNAELVLQDISFTVNRGDMLAIIGPNGSGKTTLFRALLGLVRHEGEIIWQHGQQIGYVPQKLTLDRFVPLTVSEFLLLQSPRFWLPAAAFLAHLPHELRIVGLDESILPRLVGELSSGQLQRLLVSWAMLNHPEILLFDEPTAGVDIGFEETIYLIMDRLREERGTTILFISHDLGVVSRHASHVLCLNKNIVCYGTPVDVLNSTALARLSVVSPS